VMLSRFIERHLSLAATAFCALSLAYLYLLDHALFSSAHFTSIFRFLLTTYDLRAAWLGLAICIFSAWWSRPGPILRWVGFWGLYPAWVALAATAMLALAAITIYHDYPLSMDEYAAVFQSKIFAAGHVVAQLPRGLVDWLVVRGFNGSFLIASPETGRAIESYWPGFALLLTPFQFVNAAWLCNALLSGLSILLIYRITREITGDRFAAGWAMLFTLSSGAFIADGISYYSMQAHLAANLMFVALIMKPSARRALAAGLVGSLALNLHNPVPHALFALPWIAAMATRRDRYRLLPLILGYLPGIAIAVLWLRLRTDIGLIGHGLVALHTIVSGVFSLPDAGSLNTGVAALFKMSVWAMPSLFLLALLGGLRYRANPHVRLLTWSALLTFGGYLFVAFDQGHGWGYRYFHSAWGVLPILAGCAMAHKPQAADLRLVSFAGATAILSLLILVPFQMSQIERFISAHLAQLAPPMRPGNNVYFVHPLGGFYVADLVQIDPLLCDRDLILISHGAQLDAQLVQSSWPSAVKVSSGRTADQWYLGPEDQRKPVAGNEKERQFVIKPP
jgi:hypothetical protein